MRRLRDWAGALAALVTVALAIGLVETLWPRPDFRPFLMTIEYRSSQRIGYSDGRVVGGTTVYRLEYHRYDEWTLTVVSDDLGVIPGQGNACRDGTYGHIDIHGVYQETSRDPAMCNGVSRWVHYGIAWSYPGERHEADDRIEYTDPGERVVFDARTGLPLLYEAGPVGGSVVERDVYRLERWLDGS